MIIHEKYCKKCHKITNHRELRKDYFECTKCYTKSICQNRIEEDKIDTSNPSYYIYIDGQYLYFNDMLSQNVTTKIEIKKLLNHEVLRIPMYRIKS